MRFVACNFEWWLQQHITSDRFDWTKYYWEESFNVGYDNIGLVRSYDVFLVGVWCCMIYRDAVWWFTATLLFLFFIFYLWIESAASLFSLLTRSAKKHAQKNKPDQQKDDDFSLASLAVWRILCENWRGCQSWNSPGKFLRNWFFRSAGQVSRKILVAPRASSILLSGN